MYQTIYHSPVGEITLSSDGESITGLWFKGQKHFASGLPENIPFCGELPVFKSAERWLDAYFGEDSLPAMPPLAPAGTPFQRRVWDILCQIPFAVTMTYGDIAKQMALFGHPTSARAVGNAVSRNPISIFIPCHRVLGADGNLTGYAGGLEIKRFLLELEFQDES